MYFYPESSKVGNFGVSSSFFYVKNQLNPLYFFVYIDEQLLVMTTIFEARYLLNLSPIFNNSFGQ